jgi:uncharacterized membrane protein YhaH (DUF805 family)
MHSSILRRETFFRFWLCVTVVGFVIVRILIHIPQSIHGAHEVAGLVLSFLGMTMFVRARSCHVCVCVVLILFACCCLLIYLLLLQRRTAGRNWISHTFACTLACVFTSRLSRFLCVEGKVRLPQERKKEQNDTLANYHC